MREVPEATMLVEFLGRLGSGLGAWAPGPLHVANHNHQPCLMARFTPFVPGSSARTAGLQVVVAVGTLDFWSPTGDVGPLCLGSPILSSSPLSTPILSASLRARGACQS